MKLNAEQLLKRWKRAQQGRDNFADMWQDIYDYTMPSRAGFFSNTVGEERSDLIYDETALVALDEFSSSMQQGITPQFEQWFRLEPGDDLAAQTTPTALRKFQSELDEVGTYIWEAIANSNFGIESQEVYTDIGVGWSAQLIEEGKGGNLIQFKTCAQPTVFLDVGPFGQVDGVFRIRHKVKINDLKNMYPNANVPQDLLDKTKGNPDATTDLVEATYRDWDQTEETYCYQIVETEGKTLLVEEEEKGEGSKPFVTPRWSIAAGECYGRGPLVRALPAIRTVNLVTEMVLENAQLSISGLWSIPDDGTINPDTIEIIPGMAYPRGADSDGLQPITPAGDFNVADIVLASQQENIRRALFAEEVGGDLSKTPRSATEIGGRMQRLANRIGGSFGRMVEEYSNPVVRRVVYLLKKQGKLELPKLDGREVKIVPRSPLARAQRQEDIERIRGFAMDLGTLLGNPQLIPAYIDDNVLASELQSKWEVPFDLLRNEDERKARMNEIMEALAPAGDATPDAA